MGFEPEGIPTLADGAVLLAVELVGERYQNWQVGELALAVSNISKISQLLRQMFCIVLYYRA